MLSIVLVVKLFIVSVYNHVLAILTVSGMNKHMLMSVVLFFFVYRLLCVHVPI